MTKYEIFFQTEKEYVSSPKSNTDNDSDQKVKKISHNILNVKQNYTKKI